MTSLLRRARQSKQEVTIDWQMETFCCMTTSPSPAPMMRPIRSPMVTGIIHQPSSQARMPRVAQVSVNSCMRLAGAVGHGAERVADHVGGVGEDGEFLAPGKQMVGRGRHG